MQTILICDDERDIVSALKIYLREYRTLEAHTGREALDVLLHAQKGRGEILDQTFPGPAHRGQRRDGGVENGA